MSTEELFCHIYVHTKRWGLDSAVVAPYKLDVTNAEAGCTATFEIRRRPFSRAYALYTSCRTGHQSVYRMLVDGILVSLRVSMAIK